MSETRLPKSWFQQALIGAMMLVAGYLCYTIVQPFVMPAAAATALAILFHPVHRGLLRRGWSPNAAAAVGVVAVILMTLVPAVLLSTAVARDVKSMYGILAAKSTADGGWEPWLVHHLDKPLAMVGIDVEDPGFNLKTILMDYAQSASAMFVKLLRGAISNVASLLLQSIVALFTLFFLFRDGGAIRETIAALLPLDAHQTEQLFGEVQNTVIGNMYGVVAVAATQGTLTGIAFFGLGLPSPVMWGLVAGLCSLIPLMGPPIVWAPAAIYLAVSGSYTKAAILAGLGVGVIGLADNFIRPYVLSGQVKMHPLLIFIALLGGAQAFGIMGIFIGPAVLSVTIALIEILRQPGRPEITVK